MNRQLRLNQNNEKFNTMPTKSRLSLIGLTVILTGILTIAADIEQFHGKVDLANGHYYTCDGMIVRKKGKVTKTARFYNEDGKLILTESVSYNEQGYKLNKLSIDENRYGREHEIERKNDKYVIRYRENADNKFSERIIDDQPLTLHGSYLPVYLSQNLDRINENGCTCRLIIVPRKMEIEMIFKNNGIKNIDGHECFEITMDAANILLKPLVRTHYFYYGVDESHRLYRYIGTIEPTEPNGGAIWGTTSFTYK